MQQKIYQVDAFTDKLFAGNPAAVCPLEKWLSDETMQNIAKENNLAETAFYVKQGDEYIIRWFTPAVEVDLCGHATLATAFVLFNYENHTGDTIHFQSPRSGVLSVSRHGEMLTLNFPADELTEIALTADIMNGFDKIPIAAWKGKTDYLLVFEHEDDIREMTPFFDKISRLKARGVIVTSKGHESDFVSRFFAPQVGVSEDPVTGSAHTTLTPYWAQKLGKTDMTAIQLSERKGYLQCKYLHERVEISGRCRLYLTGVIAIE
ncbi:PhzF family phenazine biosynthesis protein [Microbacter margulisiae]|uniref:PhzF family phenazine biosynthesis protein n=1 Tax=Microbacter margulisiae TaxID=1350067 RepID=A0A7W5DNU7_9PORP|nr:PhzF family phenazine biosynthesis protein [Microbacter margulisiae]MBB3186372.1 PhzF family phenazine biosynthesis protein [Microbacter margulisiae]